MGGPTFDINNETVTAAKVGIGTAEPGQKLDVRGSAYVQDVIYLGRANVEKHFIFRNINSSPPNTDNIAWALSLRTDIGGNNNDLKITRFNDAGAYQDIPIQISQASGNVGIGTTGAPSEKLEVNGNVKAAGTVISATPGGNGTLLRDVDNDYLSISGGKTRRGPTSGGLIQLMGNARAQNPGSIQYILGEGAASPKHIFYDNGPDATIQEIASIDNSGNASFNGNVTAANNVRARETGWFSISGLQEVLKDNTLGVIPKGITVFCASPTDQSEVTVAGPTVAHWHDWGGSDYGAFLRVTATQIRVRAGNYVGWHSGGWQTSGYYNIVFWA